ncbi:MAG: tetratricopeptide repeat protein, partial [Trebonia sp.]
RSVTTGRRMIIVLDDAASAAQVRMLLPGPGPGRPGPGRPSLVVVTSRWRLAGLAMDGARFLELGPLTEPEALDLLDRVIGADRTAAEPGERHALARLCHGLPLALCIIAARLAAHPRWPLSRLAGELASERSRLHAMSLDGDVSVRAAFDIAYQALGPETKRAYRMTSFIPGPDFDVELAAATLSDRAAADQAGEGQDRAHVRDALDTLADASLLTEADDARYRFHDLARLHAQERADSIPGERPAALARSISAYLDRAVKADFAVSPGRWRLNPMYDRQRPSSPASAPVTEAADAADTTALDSLDAWLPGFLAAVEAAHRAGLHRETWQLCESLWSVFVLRKHFSLWISAHHTGIAAAEACGDTRALARMHVQLGIALLTLHRYDEARQHFVPALELARRDGHLPGQAAALEQIGLADLSEDAPDAAITRFAEARDINRQLGVPRGVALAARRVGEAQRDLGRYDDALRELAEARRIFASFPDAYMEMRTLTSLAQTLLLAGRAVDAVEPLTAALATATRLRSRYEQARVARYLGVAARQADDMSTARRHLSDALAGFEATGAPDAEEVRRELAALDTG